MAARSIASATISFGLVTIPVRLFPATQSSASISFHLLHRGCGSRLRQQYICPKDQAIVPRDDMVKGYEFAKDQYVVFTPEELKALEENASHTIDISEFVPLERVDPVYFDKPYYLAPDKGGEKAYHLLGEVMRDTGRCALAKYAARGKQYLVLVRPLDRGLAMQQLLYADEVRSIKDVGLPDVPKLNETELRLAHQLVDQISAETFNPAAYEDEVKKRIQADIQKKIEGQEIEFSEEAPPPAQVIDLMEALKASLGGAKGRRPAVRGDRAGADERERKPAKPSESGQAARAAHKRVDRRARRP